MLGLSSSLLGNHLKNDDPNLCHSPSVSTLWRRGMQLFDSCIPPRFPVWVEKKAKNVSDTKSLTF